MMSQEIAEDQFQSRMNVTYLSGMKPMIHARNRTLQQSNM